MSSNVLANLEQLVKDLKTLKDEITETSVSILDYLDSMAYEITEIGYSALYEGFRGYVISARNVCNAAYRWASTYQSALEDYLSSPEKRGPFKFKKVFQDVEISQKYVTEYSLAFNQALDEVIFAISSATDYNKDLFEALAGEEFINEIAKYLNLLRQFQATFNKFVDEAIKLSPP
ncbi:MAG: hypothetical protein QW046_05900 [Candidatus Micrarchaeaceae archaeon]